MLHSLGVLDAAVRRAEERYEFFMRAETWYDVARGGPLPVSFMDACEVVTELVQSAWAPGTRLNYQGYVIQWIKFCACVPVEPLPVDGRAFESWVSYMLQSYAGATVEVAISALISWSVLNRMGNFAKEDELTWCGYPFSIHSESCVCR